MRVKRAKNNKRTIRFYQQTFGLKEPFRVLIDGTFINAALKNKIHIKEQLPKMLGAKCTPMITGCAINELRSLGSSCLGAVVIAKGYYRLKCGHDENPLGAHECMACCVGAENKGSYLVATQDESLRKKLRAIPGVPILKLEGQCPVLEEASGASKTSREQTETEKCLPKEWEKKKLPELSKPEPEMLFKKKKKKGKNPLSCKKKKSKTVPVAESKKVKKKALKEGGGEETKPVAEEPKAEAEASKPEAEVPRQEAEAPKQEAEEPPQKKKKVRSRRMAKEKQDAAVVAASA